jgi:NAD(P)-dependent dehydrogenase (short-subunit alcohol dehydrogenase family)
MFDRLFDGYRANKASVDVLHPNGRVSTPEEMAEIAVWLCSDRSSYVVGHALVADGGLTAGLWGGARGE